MDDLTKITDRFRREIRRAESRGAKQLEESFRVIWLNIRLEIQGITRRIAEARGRGETVNQSWLFANVRLDALEQQIEDLIGGFDVQSRQAIRAAQETGIEIKQSNLSAAMRIVRPSFFAFPAGAVAELIGILADGSPVVDRINLRQLQTGSAIRDMLIRGVALGWNPRRMEREARQTVGRVIYNVLRIHRTEALRAFREAGRQTRLENPDIFMGWIWLSAADSRTCASCWAMHGTRHTNRERLDDHPQGRCVERELIKGFQVPDIKTGGVLFAQMSEQEQRKILSPAKYEAYRNGQIELENLVGRQRNAFGTTRREISLKAALEAA